MVWWPLSFDWFLSRLPTSYNYGFSKVLSCLPIDAQI